MRALRSLLYGGIGFYTGLLGKLRRQYSLPLEEEYVEYDALGMPLLPGSRVRGPPRAGSDMDVDSSHGLDTRLLQILYRCYLYLGDLGMREFQ